MKRLGLAVLLWMAASAQADPLADRAAAIKPAPAELAWMRIPWLTSLVEAERIAQAENRPILFWNVDDDPLERC